MIETTSTPGNKTLSHTIRVASAPVFESAAPIVKPMASPIEGITASALTIEWIIAARLMLTHHLAHRNLLTLPPCGKMVYTFHSLATPAPGQRGTAHQSGSSRRFDSTLHFTETALQYEPPGG